MANDLDKTVDTPTDENVETKTPELDLNDPVTFITALVEKNKDDEDFIVGANNVINHLKGSTAKDLEKENARLKDELARSKNRFYETFMGKVTDDVTVNVDEEEEINTTITVNDLLQKLERK